MAITKTTIVLKAAGSNGITSQGPSRYEERNSASGVTVTPGDILKLNSSGLYALPAAGDAGLKLPVIVARENELLGKAVTETYAAGDRVYSQRLVPNDEFHARLAAGQNIAYGAFLALVGTGGTLKVAAADDVAMFQAIEAVDNSAGSDAVLIAVRVIEGITV